MLLSSSTYFIFLVAIFFLYWPLSRGRASTLAILLFANYFFYARWHIGYLLLIPLASTVDYLVGLGLQRYETVGARRALIAVSLAMNIGLIALFKFVPASLTLSFYAFQSLTYTLDLYRKDAKGTHSYLAYLSAVSFFPTIIAGPITRVSSLLDQFERSKKLDAETGGRALFLIGIGLIKKLMIADYLSANLVNRVFDFPNLYTGVEVLAGVYAYAFQIYCDFSGYTDIAIGSAMLLGIKLPQNFNAPYMADNIADFWRRWHISLSNWLRDYLYFSLPGQRTRVMPYLNLLITMVLGGLWHGFSRNFALWGALHGLGLVTVRLWQVWQGNSKAKGFWLYANRLLTFHFVTLAWVFFRAPDYATATAVLGRLRSLTASLANLSAGLWVVLAIAVATHYIPKKWFEAVQTLYVRAPFYAQAAALAALVVGLQYVGQTGAAPFIYTKF